ncbi:hypothetical protein BJ165DRAFT_1159945 [Panaeolus papilionaceus]|nr:hypothetical protein BJ165DRAFT_1159945 [Panaeolus papilionaceus]
MPTNFIWLGFFWLIGKCRSKTSKLGHKTELFYLCVGYVNSFLAALNSRESLREQVAAQQDGTFLQLTPFRAMNSVHHSEAPHASIDRKENPYCNAAQPLAVTVQTQTVTRCDYEFVVSTPVTANDDKSEASA